MDKTSRCLFNTTIYQKKPIVFGEVSKLASNLKNIHVAIHLNISIFNEQGNILEIYLKNLANCTSSKIGCISFTGHRIVGTHKNVEDFESSSKPEQISPHNETLKNRLDKDSFHKRLKQDIA
jgi:hypothetical protein